MSPLERSGEGSGGEQWFTFEHSPQYQQVQFLFLDAVQSYNPQNIAVSGGERDKCAGWILLPGSQNIAVSGDERDECAEWILLPGN